LEQFDYHNFTSHTIKNNFPNLLTVIRLVCSPIILPFLIVGFLPYNFFWLNCIVAIFFCFFALTDFFDGYLARRLNQETTVGKVLDPIADKFLLYSTLVALLAAHKIFFYWVILFIGREFFIMGLRYVALEQAISVSVSMLGKIKTTIQMIMLCVMILNPYHALGIIGAPGWNGTEFILIFLALAMSLFSAKQYYHVFMNAFRAKKDAHEEMVMNTRLHHDSLSGDVSSYDSQNF
jgi:CDP-diacylglycerol--glycerol-3-phosphate 3-phosphatidyltransferase